MFLFSISRPERLHTAATMSYVSENSMYRNPFAQTQLCVTLCTEDPLRGPRIAGDAVRASQRNRLS